MARPAQVAKTSNFTLLLSAAIVIAGLYFAQEVLIPVALAVLFSFLLTPAVQWLEQLHVPRLVATLIVVLIGVGSIGTVAYMGTRQLASIVENFPSYQGQLRTKVRSLGKHGGFLKKVEKEAAAVASDGHDGHSETQPAAPAVPYSPIAHFTTPLSEHPAAAPVPAATPSADNPVPVRVIPGPESTWAIVRDYSSKAMSPLATTVIVLVLVIFMLMSREDLRDRLIRLLGHGRLNLTTQALDEASTRISKYLGALAIVNICYAFLTAVGLWLIAHFLGHGQSFPNVLVWGVLVGVLRFVPYVGIWIGAGIPLVLAFALFPGYGVFFGTLALFAVLEIIVSQAIEPTWYGSTTGMSALAVLVAAIFWTWLWGPIGLLLSTPLTVILVVMGKYVPQLKFLDILLREEPVLAPPFRVYQRLIAMDQEDAADLARDYLNETKSLEACFDDLLIPALSMAEHDSHHERVADEQLAFVRQSVRDLVEELTEQYRTLIAKTAADELKQAAKNEKAPAVIAPADNNGASEAIVVPPKSPGRCPLNVLCLPARDEADEIVALMFSQLIELRGYCALAPSSDVLAGEMMTMVENKQIDLVCVSAMPPAAVAHSRYLCKRLHSRFPDLGLIVGLWTSKGDLNKAKERIACSSAVPVVTTLHDAQEQLEQLAQPLIVRAASNQSRLADSPRPVLTTVS